MNRTVRLTLIAALSILAGGRVSQTLALDYSWNVSSGNWSTAGDWKPSGGPPTLNDPAWVVNGGTVTIPSGVSATCYVLFLGGAASGTVQLVSGASLTGSSSPYGLGEDVGYTGNGTFIQSGGANTAYPSLLLGDNTGSSGSYNLSGGSLWAAYMIDGNSGSGAFTQSGGDLSCGTGASSNESVGYTGNGTFIQSGGINNAGVELALGYMTGSDGTYNLSGGSLVATNIGAGGSGSGAFTQSGGTISANNVNLGADFGGSGSYNLSGGLLATSGLTVGSLGSGAFTQTGGTIAVTSALYVGFEDTGSYTLGGSGYLSASYQELIGDASNGSFIQTGGTHSAFSLVLGNNTASSGSYNLSGGSLATSELIVGSAGSGAFTQSGGTNSGTSMGLGTNGGTGSYVLSGGSLATSDLVVGYSGSGTFTQSGGTNSCGVLYVGNASGGTGSYVLSGGLLALGGGGLAAALGSAAFNFGGGTLGASATWSSSAAMTLTGSPGNATVDTTGGNIALSGALSGSGGLDKVGPNTLTLSGPNTFTGNLTVDGGTLAMPGGTLTPGEEYVGYSNTAGFAQSGGANLVANNVVLGYNSGSSGSYSLSGGSLVVSGAEFVGYSGSGVFTQTGGTNSIEGNIYVGANAPASGSYSLSGSGYLYSADTEYIGLEGNGTFTQTGGTNSTAAYILLGFSVGSSGSYSLSGGYLATAGEYIGYSGSGAFTQSGGTNSAASGIVLGSNAGSSDSYSLSGGSLFAGYITDGNFASGTFTQTGGTASVGGSIYVGANAPASGSYSLSGSGCLLAPTEYVGYSGSGSLSQSGGTNSAGVIYVGVGGSGDYSLSGGLLTAGTVALGAQPGFTQTGGTSSPSSIVYSGSAGGSGLYSLSGGLLTAGTVTVGTQVDLAQTGGTVGPGALVNSGSFSYAGGTFNGQLVNYGTCIFNGSFYASEGIINYATFNAIPAGVVVATGSGTFSLDNEGTIILAGGSLAGGQTAGRGGPIVNNGLITGYGGLTSGVGITNNTQITQSGGNLAILAGAAGMTNLGTISLESGYQLTLSGSALINLGTVNLNSSIVAGSGLLNNAGGNIEGPGTISVAFENAGGILSVPLGTTYITQPFQNSGSIQLWGFTADLTGGSIANSGSIQGNGLVNNAVNNTGTIESIEGTLTLSGSLRNSVGGLLAVDDGSKLVVSSGLAANYGTISLTGGVFDNSSYALSNSGEISGYGTFRSGGLANYSAVIFTGGASTVNGPVTNAGDIDLGGTSTMVVNNGAGVLAQSSGTLEMGTGASLSAGSVAITGGILLADGPAALITANLVYTSSSASTYQGILAGAGNTLTVDNPAAVLVLSGSGNSYTGGTFVTAGDLVVTSPGGIESSTALAVGNNLAAFGAVVPASAAAQPSPVPEPGALALVAFTACIVVLYRKCRR